MAALREDKKLAKFFMTDKPPSKRLKSAFKFCSTSTPSNVSFFFREKSDAVRGTAVVVVLLRGRPVRHVCSSVRAFRCWKC